jgi:hypothetical protein
MPELIVTVLEFESNTAPYLSVVKVYWVSLQSVSVGTLKNSVIANVCTVAETNGSDRMNFSVDRA